MITSIPFEVYASTNEFEISKERIKEDSLTEYFKKKEGLKHFISSDETQTQLI